MLLTLDAYIVVDKSGEPARMAQPSVLPVRDTKKAAARLARYLDHLTCEADRRPHRAVSVKIEET